MNRLKKIEEIRSNLKNGSTSIGSWMQIPHSSIAEIMGNMGYDWVAIDMEHGAIGVHQLPDLFRALELGGTLPLARLSHGKAKECKQALDAGAGGVIVPMIENAEQLIYARDACRWPPAGLRGVGFSRANLFGENFESYQVEAQAPLLIAMIENINAVDNLAEILDVDGLDAIMIGPYDLSASMSLTAQFEALGFTNAMGRILTLCNEKNTPCGLHVVMPDTSTLHERISDGYRFIAYSIDSVFLSISSKNPVIK
jgi:2-dehydro-3-deoxyglucarate aldolase